MGISNVDLAENLGVTEGAIRYQLKGRAEGRTDRRQFKPSRLDRLQGIIGR
jgi:hypothetical protein